MVIGKVTGTNGFVTRVYYAINYTEAVMQFVDEFGADNVERTFVLPEYPLPDKPCP
jgi:hypothetical protein